MNDPNEFPFQPSKERTRYRRLSWVSDWRGIKSAIGELRGLGHPPQPKFRAEGDQHRFNETWFIDTLKDKLANHPANAMEYPLHGERIFELPLVGFVRADDPIFEQYKTIIGPHHLTPHEWIAIQAEWTGVPVPPVEECSVVVFIMPMTTATRKENAQQKKWPSMRWAHTRLLGEQFSQIMVREIVTECMAGGVLAIAPDTSKLFNKKRYPESGWGSPWSHRHAAFAAGLGTFGLHDFFLTEKGAAHRLGSFIVHRPLTPNRQRPEDHRAHCLQHQGHECMRCAQKCPVDAITAEGHDKEACYKHVANSLKHCNNNYHIFIYGCGLCSVGVPCAAKFPKAGAKAETLG